MAKKSEEIIEMSRSGDAGLCIEALNLMHSISRRSEPDSGGVEWLIKTCESARGRDVLFVHSPGGWGCSDISHLIDWERSVVDGIQGAAAKLGLNGILVQYFRTGSSSWNHLLHTPEQLKYALTGKIYRSEIMAAQLKFILAHMENINIVLLGVSQGAAFNNTVMKHMGGNENVYSIELGTFFAQLQRRIITGNTLAIDSNGLMPDPVVHRNVKAAIRAYSIAPFSWVKYKLAGEPVKFTYCINVPGHDYNWKYPDVRKQITEFLVKNLKNKNQ